METTHCNPPTYYSFPSLACSTEVMGGMHEYKVKFRKSATLQATVCHEGFHAVHDDRK